MMSKAAKGLPLHVFHSGMLPPSSYCCVAHERFLNVFCSLLSFSCTSLSCKSKLVGYLYLLIDLTEHGCHLHSIVCAIHTTSSMQSEKVSN